MTSVDAVTSFVGIDLIRVGGIGRAVSTIPSSVSAGTPQMDLILEDEDCVVSVDDLRSRTYALDLRGVGYDRTKGHE